MLVVLLTTALSSLGPDQFSHMHVEKYMRKGSGLQDYALSD